MQDLKNFSFWKKSNINIKFALDSCIERWTISKPWVVLTLLLLRPRAASAVDKDCLLKFRKPLRLFGRGGKPSIFGLFFVNFLLLFHNLGVNISICLNFCMSTTTNFSSLTTWKKNLKNQNLLKDRKRM